MGEVVWREGGEKEVRREKWEVWREERDREDGTEMIVCSGEKRGENRNPDQTTEDV